MKYEYKKIKGFKKKKFLENGHIMFEEDVLRRLERLVYLEEYTDKLNEEIRELKKIISMNFFLNMNKPELPKGKRWAHDGQMELYDNLMKWYEKAEKIRNELNPKEGE
jgi:hypothetical protein